MSQIFVSCFVVLLYLNAMGSGNTHTYIPRDAVGCRGKARTFVIVWLLAWAYADAWLASVDFEYKQNRRTHSFTLTPRTCTNAYTRRQTSIYADESTHTHLGISIRINNYTNSMRRLSHAQAHAHWSTHLIQSHAHTHIFALIPACARCCCRCHSRRCCYCCCRCCMRRLKNDNKI